MSLLISKLIEAQGFELFGVASANDPSLSEAALKYDNWIRSGMHSTMDYLARHREKKFNVEKFLPGARSVVVVGAVYANADIDTQNRAVSTTGSRENPKVSQYTAGRDYHEVVMTRLRHIAHEFQQMTNGQTRCFVDIEPVAERFWGQRAGLGWIGKNSMLINRKLGSYFFIGGFFTDIELAINSPDIDHCGRCTKCIDACPTMAITEDRTIDANRCIGYHTIENRGDISPELAKKFQGWLAGCDICQMVCPWNDPLPEQTMFVATNPALNATFETLAEITESEFKSKFKGYAMERMKYSGFLRNLKNAKDSLESEGS